MTDLFTKRTTLEQMNCIADMRQYAAAWLELADKFDAVEMPFNGAYCRSRGNHYADMAGGEYIRLTEGSLAELIEVPA